MKLPAFEYACPSTLREAVALLASGEGDAKVLAGGQSLVPMMAFRVASPALVVDLRSTPPIPCSRPRYARSPTIRSAIAAPSAAASHMPIRRRKCRASR
jgi:hypothetical protein